MSNKSTTITVENMAAANVIGEQIAAFSAASAPVAPAPAPAAPAPMPAPRAPAPTRPNASSPPVVLPSREQEINSMVAALADAGANMSNPLDSRSRGGMIYNSSTDAYTITAAPPPGQDNQPLYDDPSRDLQHEVDSHAAVLQQLQARLDDGKYDAATGKFKPTVTGDQRDLIQRQLDQQKISYDYTLQRLNAIAHQRATSAPTVGSQAGTPTINSRGQESTIEAEALRMSYIDTAPPGQRVQYAADWDRAMQQGRASAILSAAKGRVR
jgi:hypothetical protein